MITLTTEQFIEMERRDRIRMVVLLCLLATQFVVFAASCQQPPINGTPLPQQTPVTLGAVQVEGSCQASVGVDLQVGILALPVRLGINTHAAPGGAGGVVALDVAGLLQAQCDLIAGEGKCAVSGLLAPRPAPEVEPSLGTPAPAQPLNDGGQPDVATH